MTEEEINTYVSEKNKTKCSWSSFSFNFAIVCIIGFLVFYEVYFPCFILVVPVVAVLSVLCGIIALIKIKKSKGLLTGKIYAGIGLLVGTGFFLFFASIFLWGWKSTLYIREKESKLKSPAIYEPAAKELAQYCQAIGTKLNDTGIGNAWLPKTIRDFDPGYGYISPKDASIVFTGGFYHLSYKLELDENSSSTDQSVWNLILFTEGDEKLLYTVHLKKEEFITIDELINGAINGYNSCPNQADNKIIFLLVMNRPETAYQACKELAEKSPSAWWPRLTLAFMNATKTNSEKAGEELTQWVEKYPCFTYYYYLSFFYENENLPGKALKAVEKSIEYQLRNDVYSPDKHNVYFYASNSATLALKNNRADLAVKVCDAALAEVEHERGKYSSKPHWKPLLQKLRTAIDTNDTNTLYSWNQYKRWYFKFNPYNTNSEQRIKIGNHYFPNDEDIKADEESYEVKEPFIKEWTGKN